MGWRYQIPMLVDMGLRVVAPDCLGYGRTVRATSAVKSQEKLSWIASHIPISLTGSTG